MQNSGCIVKASGTSFDRVNLQHSLLCVFALGSHRVALIARKCSSGATITTVKSAMEHSIRNSCQRLSKSVQQNSLRDFSRLFISFCPFLARFPAVFVQLEAADEEDAGLRLPDLTTIDFGSAYSIALTASGEIKLLDHWNHSICD